VGRVCGCSKSNHRTYDPNDKPRAAASISAFSRSAAVLRNVFTIPRSRFSLPLRFVAFGFVVLMAALSFLLPSGGQRGAKLPLQGVFVISGIL
jgi:hypothetical protein